jgi:GalNAc-alpha-(1->4)-GalNAc-alpha-(1->3)-diNAcBac-PP-undecaprenol alpha-1,4-N-acetyl-D-galactosaminyltransferase
MSDLATAWAEEGKDITILTLDEYDRPAYQLHHAVKVRRVSLPKRWSPLLQWFFQKLWRLPALRNAIQQSKPDLVISFMHRPNVLTLLATRFLPVPVVVSERVNPSLHKIGVLWGGLRRVLYASSAGLVVETRATLDAFAQMIKTRCYVIPNFLRPHACFIEKWERKDKNTSDHVLAAMGRLVEQKGFDLLLEAFARVAGQHPDWSLKILGKGPLEARLKTQMEKLRLNERVHFLGEVTDPFPVLCGADLFVFPSRFEGFGLALAEAMACGLPVVSFDCPSGPGDIIRHDVDGLLVPPEDIGALAAALDRLMSNPKERGRLAIRAPEVLKRFSKERTLALWNQLFGDVTQFGRGAVTPTVSKGLPLNGDKEKLL